MFTAMPTAGQQVTLVAAEGGAVRAITPTEDDAADPSWLPDGRLLFSSARGGVRDLWVMKPDGADARRLFAREGEEWAPRLSPDGDRLLFQSERDGDTDLYVGRLDGSDVRAIATGSGFQGVASWSPDGTHVAYYSRGASGPGGASWSTAEIMVVPSEGGTPRPLTQDTVRDQSPNWSPDGSQIAWTSCASGNLEVWLMDADGANKRQLTHSVGDGGFN